MDNTYWNHSGRYQDLADALSEMIPPQDSVSGYHLDRFRRASNAYYDWYNNGLWNRPDEFLDVFGFLPPLEDDECDYRVFGSPWEERAEDAFDILVLRASYEAGLFVRAAPSGLPRKETG